MIRAAWWQHHMPAKLPGDLHSGRQTVCQGRREDRPGGQPVEALRELHVGGLREALDGAWEGEQGVPEGLLISKSSSSMSSTAPLSDSSFELLEPLRLAFMLTGTESVRDIHAADFFLQLATCTAP